MDPVYLEAPQRWNIGVIRRFMVVLGPVSSLFDFLTFGALLLVLRLQESAFQTGWFVESLATQVLVLLVIRTSGRPWTHRPSTALLVTVTVVVLAGIALPYSPLAAPLGMTPQPAPFFLVLGVVVPAYLVLAELIKGWALRDIVARGQRRPA